MKNRLEISDLSLAYGKRTILEHISFTLAAGEAVALCGEAARSAMCRRARRCWRI